MSFRITPSSLQMRDATTITPTEDRNSCWCSSQYMGEETAQLKVMVKCRHLEYHMSNPIRTTVKKYRTQVLAHGQDIFKSAINCEFLRGMDDYGNG
jgi:hypothetical protein